MFRKAVALGLAVCLGIVSRPALAAEKDQTAADEQCLAQADLKTDAASLLEFFKSRTVRLAIASPRVIVRTVDMPILSDPDTRAALQLQLGDYIPSAPW